MQFAVPIRTSPAIPSVPIRFHGLDALRGIGAVLVVLLHAGIPYMTKPLPHLVWPARDVHPCPAVDGLTWCTECFIMPLFFVLAGFFSDGLLVAKGERSFLAGRTKRLLSTQCLAALAILPLCLAVWLLGWVADGLFIPKIGGLPKELRAGLFGVAHLWFLQNLYIYCLLLCGGSWFVKRFVRSSDASVDFKHPSVRYLNNTLLSVAKPLLPAIPCALVLYFDTRIVLGFYQSFTPILSKLAYYSIYFFMGVILHRQRKNLHLHARFGKSYLCVAAVLFAVTLPMIHEHTSVALTGMRLGILVALLSLFAWFTTFGLFAIFLRTSFSECPVMRYLSEASFWVYLIHLPFVALTQIAIVPLPVPTFGKYLLAGTTALALSLMTYHVFVRNRWLGAFLTGRSGSCMAAASVQDAPIAKFPAIATSYSPPKRIARSA